MGKVKTFKNVQKRLKIFEKLGETFENIRKMMRNIRKYSRFLDADSAVAQGYGGQVRRLHGLKMSATKASAFAKATADRLRHEEELATN